MLGLLLILLFVWVALLALFWASGSFLQSLLYNDPVEGLMWRSAVAATLVAGFFGAWCFLDYRYPGRHDTLFRFSASDDKRFSKLWAEKDKELVPYRERLSSQGERMPVRIDYVEVNPPYRPLERTGVIVVEEDGQQVRFVAPRDENGVFITTRAGVLIYRDDRGREMSADAIGVVSVFHWDVFLINMVMNLVHVVLWFVCFWLVLRFQWAHALGLTAAAWIGAITFVLPLLFDRFEAAGRAKQEAAAQVAPSARSPGPAGPAFSQGLDRPARQSIMQG